MTERLNKVVKAGLEVHTVNKEQALLGRHRLDKRRVGSAAQGGPRGMSTFRARNKGDPARRPRPTPSQGLHAQCPLLSEPQLLTNTWLLKSTEDTGPHELQPWRQAGFWRSARALWPLGFWAKEGAPSEEEEMGRSCGKLWFLRGKNRGLILNPS